MMNLTVPEAEVRLKESGEEMNQAVGNAIINAIILAGQPNDGPFREVSDAPNEALIPVAGKSLLTHVLRALVATERVDRIVVVGPKEAIEEDIKVQLPGAQVEVIESGATVLDNLRRGLESLPEDKAVLVSTADIPLISGPMVDDLIHRCAALDADLCYPIVKREDCETAFPGVRRTYVFLTDGVFTGGNLFYVRPSAIKAHYGRLQEFYGARKQPLKMAAILGWGFLMRLVLKQLSINQLEEAVARIFNLRGRAVVVDHPEIGVDVDKPSDLRLVKELLEGPAREE